MSGDALCILPWIHLEVVPEGNAKVCCVAKESIRDKGTAMNVASSSLEQIRGSSYMRSVREALAGGRKIPVCSYCWDQEKRGESSQRALWNGMFPGAMNTLQQRLREGASTSEPMPMEYLQISVGNQCNLACRMCNSSYSSRIEADPVHSKWAGMLDRQEIAWKEVDRAPRALRAVFDRPAKPRAGWTEGVPWFEQPEFVEKDMMGAGSTLKILYVTGGEPLFVPAFDRILDDYVARGHAQDMVIGLNTNLFHNEGRIARAMETLLKFKHCHLGPSIDGYGGVYEYIRYPARWDIVERNIRSIAVLSRERKNLTVILTTVFQAYNCFNLVDLLRFSDELSIECKPHVLEGPAQLRPHVLPQELRLKAAEGLSLYAASPGDPGPQTSNRGHAARIARYLEGIQETPDLPGFRKTFADFTRALDESRGQSLERSVPELREMMTPPA